MNRSLELLTQADDSISPYLHEIEAQTEQGKSDHIALMASLALTASFLGGAAASSVAKPSAPRHGLFVARASSVSQGESNGNRNEGSNNGRRELVFAAVAAAVCSVAKVAMADEPKRGTPEAKKKYAPVCVTMPTARVCRK